MHFLVQSGQNSHRWCEKCPAFLPKRRRLSLHVTRHVLPVSRSVKHFILFSHFSKVPYSVVVSFGHDECIVHGFRKRKWPEFCATLRTFVGFYPLIRDLDAAPPEYAGHGPHAQNPFVRVDRWCAALPESAWTTIEVRDGEKGPLTVDVVKRRVRARTPTGGTGPDEVLFITRERQANGKFKHDYYMANCDPTVSLQELARVAKAAHRIEECLKRAKGEAGLGDYQVRTWIAWHHHQTLALLAAWFLNQETRRGKNRDPRAEHATPTGNDRGRNRRAPEGQRAIKAKAVQHALAGTERVCSVLLPSFS
jgi:hypothetical protein